MGGVGLAVHSAWDGLAFARWGYSFHSSGSRLGDESAAVGLLK